MVGLRKVMGHVSEQGREAEALRTSGRDRRARCWERSAASSRAAEAAAVFSLIRS